ncbi:DivIVA domain-containing protein [Streptomyces sp. ISL-11]|uniref:DivIVA domain-containing protein n=1 Tax=Streptomyces sp. ISL-11 TaxID=2819174 RepID=UPI001BEBE568|nr:DivIVA domain-containing protein [Streptomyces sp. ISL-11]MBT2386463.1 DivIVA domain-containing protein [Streptomyces sp. ISL-11]
MFWFLLIALVVVVAAVTLFVAGGSGAPLPEAVPDRIAWPPPADRAMGRADVEALRLPVALRGYRMTETDDVLDRLGAELAERDARIAELEAALAGALAAAVSGPELLRKPGEGPAEAAPENPEARDGRNGGAGA